MIKKILLLSLAVFTGIGAVSWPAIVNVVFSGAPPIVLMDRALYSNIAPLTVPIDLQRGVNELSVRMAEPRVYELVLRANIANPTERSDAARVLGQAVGDAAASNGLPTNFHIVIKDRRGAVIVDEIRLSQGVNIWSGTYIGRILTTYKLERGAYTFQVAMIGDKSPFIGLNTSLAVTHPAK